MKDIQFINWFKDGKPTFRFIRGNPLKQPAAFHLIYKWSLWLGWWEIRKFLSEKEMERALQIYKEHDLPISQIQT